MANRLIRHDARLLRRFLADGFGGPADALLLLLVVAIAAAWLSHQALALPPAAIWFALVAGPAGFAWQRLVNLRLAHLVEHSALAPAALATRERRTWLGLAHLAACAPLLGAALMLGLATGQPFAAVGLAGAAYVAGAGLASAHPSRSWRTAASRSRPSVTPLGSGGRAVLATILARQTLGAARPLKRAGLLLAMSFVLTVAGGWLGRDLGRPLDVLLPLLPPVFILLLSARLDAGLLAFLPSAGFRPGFIALAVAALPLGSLAATSGALLILGAGPGPLIVTALAHLAFILIAISRAWLYPGRAARSVELQLQLEFTGLVAIAVLLPPLAIAALLLRVWHFRNHNSGRRWRAG